MKELLEKTLNGENIFAVEVKSDYSCDICEDTGTVTCNPGEDNEYEGVCECSTDRDYDLGDFSGSNDEQGYANDR